MNFVVGRKEEETFSSSQKATLLPKLTKFNGFHLYVANLHGLELTSFFFK